MMSYNPNELRVICPTLNTYTFSAFKELSIKFNPSEVYGIRPSAFSCISHSHPTPSIKASTKTGAVAVPTFPWVPPGDGGPVFAVSEMPPRNQLSFLLSLLLILCFSTKEVKGTQAIKYNKNGVNADKKIRYDFSKVNYVCRCLNFSLAFLKLFYNYIFFVEGFS
jgi:hypothetical protein